MSIPIPSTPFTLPTINLPGVNVVSFGAVGDDATDNTAAFATAYSSLVGRGGGQMFIPTGIYRMASFPAVTGTGIWIVGEAQGQVGTTGTILRHTGNGDFITFNASVHSTIKNLNFKPTTRKTSGYEIVVRNGFRQTIDHVRMDFNYNGILMDNTNGLTINNWDERECLGSRGLNMINGSQGLSIQRVVCDAGYPLAIGPRKTWAQSTVFNVGDIIKVNNAVYQCSQGGTSSNVGTGPNGQPAGTTPDSVFSGTVADGSVLWRWCFNGDLAWVTMDSNCGTLNILGGVGLLNGNVGLQTADGLSTGGPSFISAFDLECDHNYTAGLYLNNGISMLFTNLFAGSCLTGPGVQMNGGLRGEVAIVNSTIGGNNTHGIEIQSGPIKILIANSIITNNSQLTTHTYNGINVEGGASSVIIRGNWIGNVGDSQNYGVAISGASDRITITDNDVSGNFTAGILNTATGTHNKIVNNDGFNPVGASTLSPSASPWTFTNGAMPTTLYLSAATAITALTINGVSILPAATAANVNLTVELGPNEVAVTTYTGALTAKAMVH